MSRIRKDWVTLASVLLLASEAIARIGSRTGESAATQALGGCRHLDTVFLRMRLIEETLGSESLGQMPSTSSFSRISHAKRQPFRRLYSRIFDMTAGVETRGLLPPSPQTKAARSVRETRNDTW